MSSLCQELRFAVRTLAKSPRFALLAVATLALSIGSTSALFSVVNAVLLKPLPYRDPENLFQFSGAGLQRGRDRLSPGDYLDIKRRARSFAPLAGYRSLSCELSGNGEPQRLHAADVTADFFEVFGIGARLGRLFDARQDRPGSGRRAVMGHRLWTRQFGVIPRSSERRSAWMARASRWSASRGLVGGRRGDLDGLHGSRPAADAGAGSYLQFGTSSTSKRSRLAPGGSHAQARRPSS
jgi:hypothetical protein